MIKAPLSCSEEESEISKLIEPDEETEYLQVVRVFGIPSNNAVGRKELHLHLLLWKYLYCQPGFLEAVFDR